MLPAIGLIAASALLNYKSNRDVGKRQESIRRTMEAYQRSKAAESTAATEALMAKQTPKEREAELAAVTAERDKSMRDTVGAAQAFDAPAIAGGGTDYKAAQEKEAGSIAERTRRAIEQLATMGAPSEQQQKFNIRFGRSAGNVDAANRASERVGASYMQDIEGVRPNPMMALLSQIGMGAGAGMLARGSGGATANPSAAVNSGQGFEDASGNLYNDEVTTLQDDRIRRQLALKKGFGLFGGSG